MRSLSVSPGLRITATHLTRVVVVPSTAREAVLSLGDSTASKTSRVVREVTLQKKAAPVA
jgi:hypothetical protein